MTQPDWQPTFDAVHSVPGSTKQQPAKKSVQDLEENAEFFRKRYSSDVAVGLGAVDTGDDFDPLAWLGDYSQDLTTQFQDTWDSIVQGFTNDPQTGWNLTDVFAAALGQKTELTQIAAGLAEMRADEAANNNSGLSCSVTVSDYAPNVPSVFTLFDDSGSGAVTNDGDTLEFSNDDGRELFGYNAAELLTDYFEVSLVIPRQAGKYFFSYGDRALYFIGRGNAAWTSYCFARLNGDKLRIGCINAGSTTIDSPTWFGAEVTIPLGSYQTFRGGTIGGARIFQFLVNNQIRSTFTDSGVVSLLGSSYRWPGFGIQNDANDTWNRVPNVSHFMANDNEPAPVVGSGGHMYRTATATVDVDSGENVLPDNFFGYEGSVTPDIVVDLDDGSFTVAQAGWYMVACHMLGTGVWPLHLHLILYLGGSPHRYMGNDVARTVDPPEGAGGSTVVYLPINSVVTLGYNASGSISGALTGESTGTKTYFTIAKCG